MIQRQGRSSSNRSAVMAAVVAVAVLTAACSDATDSGGGLTDAQRATTTIVELPPSSTTTTVEAGASTETDPPPEPTTTTTTTEATTTAWPELTFTLAPVTNLSQPIAMTARNGSTDLWLAERTGRVRRVGRTGGEPDSFELDDEPVIDITGRVTEEGEGGLLGLAFSADGGHLYLHYTDNGGDNVVAEYPMSGDRARADDERVLLTVEQPFSNHNGGDLAFGPDGLLYIALGDGGAGGDPLLNGQDRSTLLGSILRIDPRPGQGVGYRVPPDNPFVGSDDDTRPEIWVWGARNPWRFSFDASSGDLWIADVGQNRFEEVNLLPASQGPAGRGANLGWNLVEANEPFAGEAPPDHSPPLYAYAQRDGRCSVTGGYVYRGTAIPELDGVYLFGDFCAGEITGLAVADDGSVTVADLVADRRVDNVISFGQGPLGEVYLLEQGGRVSLLQSS